MRYLFFIGITWLLIGCRTSRTHMNSDTAPMAQKDSIVFISMRMFHDSLQQSNQIDVLEVLTRPGSLKSQLTDNRIRENYLTCITMNKTTGMRDSFLIEHPLYKEVEVFGENGQLSMQDLNLKEAQFFVRFQKKDFNTLVIKENASLTGVRNKQIKVIKY